MNPIRTRRFDDRRWRWILHTIFYLSAAFGPCFVAHASTIPKIYWETYKEINAGARPEWRGMKDVDEWFRNDSARIERLLLEWIKLGPNATQWNHAMFLAKKLPTKLIRDAIWDEMQSEFAVTVDNRLNPTEERHQIMAGALAVLVAGSDLRARPVINFLILSQTCPSGIVASYAKSLRTIGDNSSLETVEALISQRDDPPIIEQAALTRTILQARSNGEDLFADAPAQLRAVTQAWIKALETKDRNAYINVLPTGAGAGISDHDFYVELLRNPEVAEVLSALKKAIGQESYEIDRDNLQASMIVEGRYKFLYVLEPDGWRIAGPERIAP